MMGFRSFMLRFCWWIRSFLSHTFWEFPALLIGARKCPSCRFYCWTVRRRRRNTAYCDDKMNFVTCCNYCYEREEEYWAGMWSDYYRGCI